ncbi:replication initiator protein [Dipodfec virus RodF1_53]|uniref:Replication initiator protein n=1 Tax=Dipodfec virus RodF1_53 TaxID=2929302 RepID=A0A976R8X6_9VIRU|nr:replication initiator protein [Dipodfec virus RodF1_53]
MGFSLNEVFMVCFHPIHAYYPIRQTEDYYTGELKRYLKFKLPQYDYAEDYVGGTMYFDYPTKDNEVLLGDTKLCTKSKIMVPGSSTYLPTYVDVRVPCGKCIGCHADRARNYSTRAIHEYYSNRDIPSSFVTLTFNEDSIHNRPVPNYKSVYRTEISGFVKRLRERVSRVYDRTIRVFASGEYGSLRDRPHYHLIIYGFDFPDKTPHLSRTKDCKLITYYRSKFLEDLWTFPGTDISYGYSSIGEVNQSSCQYITGYVSDKLDEFGDKDYKQLGIEKPFFYTPSRPGLGAEYFNRYYKEIIANGYCHWHNKVKAPIPPYYISLLKDLDPLLYKSYKLDKMKLLIDNLFIENLEFSEQRLKVREEALKLKYDKRIRSYEELSTLHNIY